jgi:hypothetical protein
VKSERGLNGQEHAEWKNPSLPERQIGFLGAVV